MSQIAPNSTLNDPVYRPPAPVAQWEDEGPVSPPVPYLMRMSSSLESIRRSVEEIRIAQDRLLGAPPSAGQIGREESDGSLVMLADALAALDADLADIAQRCVRIG